MNTPSAASWKPPRPPRRRWPRPPSASRKSVAEGLDTLRAQSRTYTDTAGQQLDDAQRYVTERVRERPLTATLAGLGVGVLLGLLIAGNRSTDR